MNEGAPPRREYKKNFLTSVNLGIFFPRILDLDEDKPPSKFHEKIREILPLVEKIQGREMEIIDKKTDFSLKRENRISWKFYNKEKSKTLLVSSEFIQIEFNKYKNFEYFLNDVKKIYNSFNESYTIESIKKMNLRFINEINLDSGEPTDWSEYIDTTLFSFPKEFIRYGDAPLRYMNFLEFRENDCNIKFQYGIFNSEYPNKINRKEFVLDYNCSIIDEVEPNNAINEIIKLHDVEDKWFELSILDKLREEMEVVSE